VATGDHGRRRSLGFKCCPRVNEDEYDSVDCEFSSSNFACDMANME